MQASKLASGGAAVTPNDTTDLSSLAYGLWVGVRGTLKVDCAEGLGTGGATAGVRHSPPLSLRVFPFKVIRVYATGTAATGIAACFE